METKTKRGRPKLDERAEQRQIIQFSCSDGTKEVWKAYADNLGMSSTDLFYKLTEHVASQMGFITWFETMAKHYEGDSEWAELVDTYKKNQEWMESWRCVSRLCSNTLMLNKSRLIKAAKIIPEKLAKDVSEALHNHFEKRAREF